MSTADTARDAEAPPKRGTKHDALAVFLGEWQAQGTSFGSANQDPNNPKRNGFPWKSTLSVRWHTGQFYLIHDERAQSGGVFDTISVLGVDARTGRYFAQSFENHGFERRYALSVDGKVWTFSGATERATIEFSEDGRTQAISWEWKPKDQWLALCDREAKRVAPEPARMALS